MLDLDIDAKVNKGFLWLLFSGLFSSAALFVLNILLVRMLEPELFGIMALCTTIITFLAIFSSFGFGDAVINRSKNIERASNSAFSAVSLASIALAVIIIAFSQGIADFFTEPRLVLILPLTMIAFVVRSIANIPASLLAKELLFKKIALIELVSSIANPIIAVAAIFFLRREMLFLALPLGYAAASVIYSAAIMMQAPKMRWQIDLKETRRLFSFGYKVVTVDALSVFLLYGLNFFVGKLFDMKTLGLFVIAFTIANIPIELVSSSLARASYAGFSKVKGERKKVSRIFERVSERTVLFTAPLIFWFFVFSTEFNAFALKKEPLLGTLIALFCGFAFFRALQKNYTSMFAGIGKPELNLKVSGAELVILVVLLAIFTRPFGVIGIVASLALARLFSVIVALAISRKLLESFWKNNAVIAKRVLALAPIPLVFFAAKSLFKQTLELFILETALFFALFLAQYYLSGFHKYLFQKA